MRQAAAPSAPASVRATQPTCISTLTHDAEDRESKGSPNSGAAGESTNNLKFFDQGLSNDEVERRGASPASNEGTLSQSSTPSLAHRRRDPRSLEPIVRVRFAIPLTRSQCYRQLQI